MEVQLHRAQRDLDRVRETTELFSKVWTERKGLRGAQKLRDAALRTEEGKRLRPSVHEATAFVEDEPRRQVHLTKNVEWAGVVY